MLKLKLSTITLIAIMVFSACTDVNKPAPIGKTPNDSPSAKCMYYIPDVLGKEMIKRYDTFYAKDSNLLKEVWIDSCFFYALDSFFLDKGKDFDGVRFYMGVDKDLIIVPTSAVNSPSDTYKHTDRYDVKINIDSKYCFTNSIKINIAKKNAEKLINDFGEKFRGEMTRGDRSSANSIKRALSSSIWMDKCVINLLRSYLKEPKNKLDGIMAFSAAYSRAIDSNVGQLYPLQTTLIFVPTSLDRRTGNHIPQWDLITPPSNLPKEKYIILGGVNHSQLCPQICN
jgi:hypothetical protein